MTKQPEMFAIVVLLCGATWISAQERPDLESIGFIKGYSWGWIGSRGEYASPEAKDSMLKLSETGTEWVCISFAARMTTASTPEIRYAGDEQRMVTDTEIRRTIDLARANGMKVILKPMVICDDQTWRAWIKFLRPVTDEERSAGITGEMDPWSGTPGMRDGMVRDMQQWDRWWNSYTDFLVHYAKIADQKGVPILCIGSEMNSTEEYEQRWRRLIEEIRNVYRGLLTYDVNHGREDELLWWDAVDLISVSAYYQVPPADGEPLDEAVEKTTSVEEIKDHLETVRERLAKLSAEHKKPILFIETGVTNVRGCARYPWSHPDERMGSPLDEQEQANYYQAMLEVFWDEPWFLGFCWWDWPARLYDESAAGEDRGFCVYGKQAEDVLREWYAKPRETATAE
jgi:sugar phosphate isomerase/epimerase